MSLKLKSSFRIPHFKGFQQHDSHELLRNLLDSVKSEELKVMSKIKFQLIRHSPSLLFFFNREDNRQY